MVESSGTRPKQVNSRAFPLNQMPLLERFFRSIKDEDLIDSESRLLLAVSGGPDSIAMLHLFYLLRDRLKVTLSVAHLNHQLRGKEADHDARFVQGECAKLNIPCYPFSFNVSKFAIRRKLSIEAAGRRIRHHFFHRLGQARKFDCICFAHTADDQVETVLFNLLRGAGPQGLSGISPKSRKVIHPLLQFRKDELLQFLKDRGLKYRIDRTNQDLQYARNRIRVQILPFLKKQCQGDIETAILRTADLLREEQAWIESLILPSFEERFSHWHEQVFQLKMDPEEPLPTALKRRLVRKFLEKSMNTLDGITFMHVERILDLLDKPVGKRFELGNYIIERTSKGWASSAKFGKWLEQLELQVPGNTLVNCLGLTIGAEILKVEQKLSLKQTNEAFLDYALLSLPLTVRSRKEGDSFHPIGLNRQKKLQDYFVDRKIPKIVRDRIPLLISGQHIVWIGGHGIDHRFQITPATRKILHLQITYA